MYFDIRYKVSHSKNYKLRLGATALRALLLDRISSLQVLTYIFTVTAIYQKKLVGT